MTSRPIPAAKIVANDTCPHVVEQMAAALRFVNNPCDVEQRLNAYLDADIEFPDSNEEHEAADKTALSIELARRLSGEERPRVRVCDAVSSLT